MTVLAWTLIAIPAALGLYAYVGYPLLLRAAAGAEDRARADAEGGDGDEPAEWPTVSISLPAYNEEESIRETLEGLLALDYPADRLQILVVSDASTDRTDEIVREFEGRGVELLRLDRRTGKTGAENAAAKHLRGEIVVNTDATIGIPPGSLRPLVRAFRDPSVGVASGRDVSVAGREEDAEIETGESGYVGYEMWVRALETRAGSIVGASGCLYAIRGELHRGAVPEGMSRDFAAALTAREHGYRAVSVQEAVCRVPRTASLRREHRRKARTMARGLATLAYKRHLLNPLRNGAFALMLFSHKLCRWLLPLALPLGLAGLILLAFRSPVALVLAAAAGAGIGLGAAGMLWPEERTRPRILAVFGYLLSANLAALMAWGRALQGVSSATWEPTRR